MWGDEGHVWGGPVYPLNPTAAYAFENQLINRLFIKKTIR